MFRFLVALVVAVFTVPLTLQAKTLEEMFPDVAEYILPEFLPLIADLDYQQGQVTIDGGRMTFDLGTDYYFLGAADAQHVLTEVWGNPPQPGTLGMIFPVEGTPLHDVWGVEISYDDMGHVSDNDAEGYDYTALLSEMQSDTRAENTERREQGYQTVELVGWAEPPRYDRASRKLYWAKELRFEGEPEHTLNYNIRVLGREGVMNLNFIAGMSQLAEVKAAAPGVLALANFGPGHTYDEFDPSLDKVAAVGIGGLIAGKVAAKTGFLAVALIFLKKFWFLFLIPLIWLKKAVFRGRSG